MAHDAQGAPAQDDPRATEDPSLADAPQDHAVAHTHDAHHHEDGFWRKYVFSTDHKMIGLQYGFTSLFFLFFGFSLIMVLRWQLAHR